MSIWDEDIQVRVHDVYGVGKCRSCHRQANAHIEVIRDGRRASSFTCRLCMEDGIRWGLIRQATWDEDEPFVADLNRALGALGFSVKA